jgi:hypothetical protein
MLHTIHIAITQAGANFQWGDYDRCPELQTHTLLGVGKPAVALKEAGSGLVTNTVGAAAKSVLRASREDRGTVTGNKKRGKREQKKHAHTHTQKTEKMKEASQRNKTTAYTTPRGWLGTAAVAEALVAGQHNTSRSHRRWSHTKELATSWH